MSNIYNLFKFLEKKRGTETPLQVKLLYAPNELTDEELNVEGHLDLALTKITSLPNNLQVRGDLDLSYTSITSLPDNLQVGGNLVLNYSKISSIPNNLKVERSLFLDNTPLAKKYDKGKIIKMILNKGGYFKGNLYGVD